MGPRGVMPGVEAGVGDWIARLLAAVCLALMLGACTKCDVPTWPRSAPEGLLSCRSDAPVPR